MDPKWVKELFTLNKELTVGETDSVGTILNVYNNVVALLINTQYTEDYGGRFKFKGGKWFLFVFEQNTDNKQWFYTLNKGQVSYTADTMYGISRYLVHRVWHTKEDGNEVHYCSTGDIPLWQTARCVTQSELDRLLKYNKEVKAMEWGDYCNLTYNDNEDSEWFSDVKSLAVVTDLHTNPDWAEFRTQEL